MVVLPSNPAAAALYCANFDGNCVVPDVSDEYGTTFVTLTGCVAVEVTGMDPLPGVNSGWTYEAGEWVAPPEPVEPQSED